MKSCAAQEIGQQAVLLCVYVSHTEDAMRYTGPCKFWNEQLMNVLGFTSPKQLDRARDKAIQAGWLVYERPQNRAVGRYYTTVPEQYASLDDTPVGENGGNRSGIHSTNHSQNRSESDPITSQKGDESGNECETNSGMKSGKPSMPIPSPPPPPGADPEKPLVCAGGVEQVIIPEKLNTPECLAAAERWFDYLDGRQLQDRNPRYNAPQLQVWWQKMGRKTPAEFLRDIEGSIAKGWKAVEDCSPIDWTGKAAGSFGVDPDFLKAREAYKRWSDGTDDHKRKRAEFLGPYLIKVCRKVGGQCFVSAKDGPEMQRLAAEFDRVKKELAE